MPRQDQWSDEELTVLMALFIAQPFAAGDDAHPRNARIAEVLGRRPTAIDRQWRNIKHRLFRLDLTRRVAHSNVGANVKRIVDRYRTDLRRLRRDAEAVMDDRRWRRLKPMLDGRGPRR